MDRVWFLILPADCYYCYKWGMFNMMHFPEPCRHPNAQNELKASVHAVLILHQANENTGRDHLWFHIFGFDFFMWALRCWCWQRARMEGWLFRLSRVDVCDGILEKERCWEESGLEKALEPNVLSGSKFSCIWCLMEQDLINISL